MIKSFATKIALEHDTINDTFIQIIIKKRILLIEGLQPKFKKELSKLERTTQAFDHAFLEAILLNYRRSITNYENYISKIDDVELKPDVLTMLAVKKVQLTEAQHLMDQID